MSRQAYVEVWTYADPTTESLKAAKNVEVEVFKAGTSEKATIYEQREGGSALANPFFSQENGLILFWAGTGDYDIKIHDTTIPARFGDLLIGWQSAPVNVEIDAGELSNKGDVEWTQESNGAWVAKLKSGIVGLDDLENAAFIPSSRLDATTQQTLFQSGDIKTSARSTAPTGWLLCNGASLLRTDYATLYSAIGTVYGAADGTHFSLPNLSGRVPIGPAGATYPLGGNGGEASHVLSTLEMPQHYHGFAEQQGVTALPIQEPFQIVYNNYNNYSPQGGFKAIAGWGNQSQIIVGRTDWNGYNYGHNNMQPYLVINSFIKT